MFQRKSTTFATVLFALILTTPFVGATSVLDQQSGDAIPNSNNGFSYISNGYGWYYGEVFTADTTNISGGSVYISDPNDGGFWPISPTANLTISAYDLTIDAMVGQATNEHMTSGWNDAFWTPGAVNIGDLVMLYATSNEQFSGMLTYAYYPSPSRSIYYTDGTNYADSFYGTVYTLNERLYTDTDFSVPEPTTLAMMMTGLFANAASRRKKNPA